MTVFVLLVLFCFCTWHQMNLYCQDMLKKIKTKQKTGMSIFTCLILQEKNCPMKLIECQFCNNGKSIHGVHHSGLLLTGLLPDHLFKSRQMFVCFPWIFLLSIGAPFLTRREVKFNKYKSKIVTTVTIVTQ